MTVIDFASHRRLNAEKEAEKRIDAQLERDYCLLYESQVRMLEQGGMELTTACISVKNSFRRQARIMNEIADAIDAELNGGPPRPPNPA